MLRATLALLVAATAGLVAQGQQPAYDVVIRGGRVVDGTGSPWFRADVAIKGDTIVAIAPRIDGAGGPRDRCHRPRGQPGLHRHSHARAPRHLPGSDGGQLHAPGRHLDIRGAGRRVAAADQGVSRSRRGHPHFPELRDVRRPGLGPRAGDRNDRPEGDARRDRQDARARAAGHARRRRRAQHRVVLRPRDLHADRGSHRAREGGRGHGRHPRVAHAQRGDRRPRQRPRDDRHRRAGRPADAGDAPQDHRRPELGPERRVAEADRGRQGPGRGRDHRSVSLHRVGDRHRCAAAPVGARRRPARRP